MRLILSLVFFFQFFLVSGQAPFREKVIQLQEQDNIGEYIYAYLDKFLNDPAPDGITMLETIEDSLWRPLKNTEERIAFVTLKSNEGYYQLQYNQISKAIAAYESAWHVYASHNLNGFDIVEYCLKPLGNAYSMLGDFESAEQIIKSYLLEATNNKHPEHLASAIINLSIVYYSTGKYAEAVNILEQGVMAPRLPEQKKGLFYANLAKNQLALGQNELALKHSQKAFDHFRKYPSWDSALQIFNTYSTLAMIHRNMNDPDMAFKNLQQALAIAENTDMITPRAKAKLNIQKAALLNEMGQNNIALNIYKNILQQLIHGYNGWGLPDKQSLYAENTLKEALDGMAGIYSQMDSLQKALNCFYLSFEVEDQLRFGYNYREAKYLQQQENRERAESALLLLIRMYQNDGSDEHIKKAFEIAENTKSIVLKSAYDQRKFWSYQKDTSLVHENNQLNLQKAQLQNEVIREQLKGKAADLKYIEQLINRQNQVMLSINKLRKKAGAGIDSMSLSKDIFLDGLQKILTGTRQTMVQYFMGSQYRFTFVLDGKTIKLYASDKIQPLKDRVRQFLSYFSDPNGINNSYEEFAQVAYDLHQQLIPQLSDTNLIIVADGILNFIPFEALLYDLPDDFNYAQWPWLLRKYTIAYRTSATELLQPTAPQQKGPTTVLGIFPEFKNTSRYLKYTTEEANEMKRFLGGKYLSSEAATREAFLKNIDSYPVLHLCTHADAGDLFVPPSIIFIDSALYLPEIYGFSLKNKLLVLSACETGIGKLHTGENAISLANGFVQAGVKNIIFSLWQVNDFSTSQLMANFYRHYSDDELAHLALRNSKLDYLKDEEIELAYKSPYFWAAFVYFGDIRP